MADENIEKQRRLARQHIATAKLLGVDFVPIHAVDEAPAMPSNDETLQAQTTSAATAILLRGAKALQTLPQLNLDEKIQALEELSKRHDATCSHCTVATAHTQTVFGEGNPATSLMFIGEAPGAEEDFHVLSNRCRDDEDRRFRRGDSALFASPLRRRDRLRYVAPGELSHLRSGGESHARPKGAAGSPGGLRRSVGLGGAPQVA